METQFFYWLDKSLWEQVFQASTILSEPSYSTPASLIVFSNQLLPTWRENLKIKLNRYLVFHCHCNTFKFTYNDLVVIQLSLCEIINRKVTSEYYVLGIISQPKESKKKNHFWILCLTGHLPLSSLSIVAELGGNSTNSLTPPPRKVFFAQTDIDIDHIMKYHHQHFPPKIKCYFFLNIYRKESLIMVKCLICNNFITFLI